MKCGEKGGNQHTIVKVNDSSFEMYLTKKLQEKFFLIEKQRGIVP